LIREFKKMLPPSFPENETQRAADLRRLNILDTTAEERFDRIARIAQGYFKVPITLVSLVDTTRQWFKSKQGLEASETPRNISFCGHAILGDDVFLVPDALSDPRFADNPLVTGDPSIRFYAGAPLTSPGGSRVGTLCIIDKRSRTLSEADLAVLRDLADWVEDELARNEREAKESLIVQSMGRLSAIVESSDDAIMSKTLDGIITSWNPGAERLFGYTEDEAINQPMAMLIPPDRGNEESMTLARIAAGVHIDPFETVWMTKSGKLIDISATISPLKDRAGKVIGASNIARDISERKRAEQMKVEFISTVSHELRTPLTSISGALGLIIGGALGEVPLPAREMIAIAHKNSQRLAHLINDLLDIEKIAAGKLHFDMQIQAIRPLIEQALEANQAYGAQRRVTFTATGVVPDVNVQVDSQRMMQVFSNLLSNAAKYSPEGGVVEVEAELNGNRMCISVRDHGLGIPAEFRSRIFQKFAQADSSDTRQKGGTGLGLAITRELVEHMNGSIGFESVEGEGSRFFVELPVWQMPAESEGIASTVANDGPRILVVEDEPDVARLLTLMLTQAGYAVDTAATGAAALRALLHSHYAAITLDLKLPDTNGLALIRQIREQPETAELPIVVVSAAMEEGRLAIKGDFSGIEWMGKPIDQPGLLGVLDRMVSAEGSRLVRVLHVEDDSDLHQVIRAMAGDRFDFVLTTTLKEARVRLVQEQFDVVILDIVLSDGSGLSLVEAVRTHQPTARVVMLTGTDITADAARQVDAVLVKSKISPDQLLAAIHTSIQSFAAHGHHS